MNLDYVNKPLEPEGEPRFTVVSTFAGCGGSSLGYKWAGGKVAAAIEWNDHAVETYRLNHRGTAIFHRDIAEVDVDEIFAVTGLSVNQLDILDGSPPCQGFSVAGKRNFDDDRNQLFREYVRLLRGLRPKAFVMENVSGMVKGKFKLIFADILRSLKDAGYRVAVKLLNTMYFGVPQSRERLIFVGVREDLGIDPSHPKAQTRPIPVEVALQSCVIPQWQMDVALETKRYAVAKELALLREGQNHFNLVRIDRKRPCPTICHRGGNHVRCLAHWSELRVMTPAELARLASFPDSFVWPKGRGSDSRAFEEIWARIGNTVPPRFMQVIAEHVRDHILEAA